MPDISVEKVTHVIVRARELDAKVQPWDFPGDTADADSILESRAGDATEDELKAFIAGLNEDEQANLVAIMWIGREDFAPEEFDDVVAQAKAERTTPTEDYLLGEPLLADYLEAGLAALGVDVEGAEEDFMRP